MTTIPIDAFPPPDDEIRRDRWGRYLVVPPGGGAPVGYTRVTTVAKALDEGGGLAPWKATMATCGAIMRPAIRAQWETLIATHNGDPWYAGTRAKAECKRLVEEAAAVGGANDRREIGTSLHAITALVDLGRAPTHLTEETERDVVAYRDGLAAAGITILPGLIEQTVVLDDYQVAGTFDRAAGVPGFELPLIADLKCGADLSYSWQGIAVQLAAYSRADALYRQGAAADGSDDVRLAMPEVDQDNGLIMWLNAGTGRLELFLVDLRAGWQAFEQSMWARTWRKATVSMRYTPGGGRWVNDEDLADALEASVARHPASGPQAPPEAPVAPVAEAPAPTPAPAAPAAALAPLAPAELVAIREWLGERIAAIGRHGPARADLGLSWPPGMPTLRASTDHTATELAEIERLVADVERRNKITFPRPRPGADDDPVGLVLHAFPHSTVVQHTPKGNPA